MESDVFGGKGEAAAADTMQFPEVAGWRDEASPFMVLIAHLGYRQAGRMADAQKALEEAEKNCDTTECFSSTDADCR